MSNLKSCFLVTNQLVKNHRNKMSYRWYVNVKEWQPTKDNLLCISKLIQPEEKTRIARFRFMKDAKSSLVGRLLIRKLLNVETKTENHNLKLIRDGNNKPILGEPMEKINFNVSHHGSYAVIAVDSAVKQLGVDLMDIEKPGPRINKDVEEYFRLMKNIFTENEWRQIKGPSKNPPMTKFTRFWCLKESYVKAIGVGIVIDLKSVEFCTQQDLEIGKVVADTKVKVNGVLQREWTFEERFLDPCHIVAVAKEGSSPALDFQEKSLDFLIENMTPLVEEDEQWSETLLKCHPDPTP